MGLLSTWDSGMSAQTFSTLPSGSIITVVRATLRPCRSGVGCGVLGIGCWVWMWMGGSAISGRSKHVYLYLVRQTHPEVVELAGHLLLGVGEELEGQAGLLLELLVGLHAVCQMVVVVVGDGMCVL